VRRAGLLAAALLAAASGARAASSSVESSRSVELVGTVASLAVSSTVAGGLAGFLAPGAKTHAAVAAAGRLLREGRGELLGRLALQCPPEKPFSACGPLSDSLVRELGGRARADELVGLLRGFETAADLAAAREKARPGLEALLASARRQAAAAPKAERAARWLRETSPVRVTTFIAPWAPGALAAAETRLGAGLEVVELRPPASTADGRVDFGFSASANSPAWRAALAVLSRHWPPLAADGAGAPPKGCSTQWDACLRSHAALAAALAADPGAGPAGVDRAAFPLLDAARRAWEPFASDRAAVLEDFVPVLQAALVAAAPAGVRAAAGPAGPRAEDPPTAGSQEAIRLAQAGDWDGALRAAESAVAKEPSDVGSWVNCGVLAGRAGRVARAQECYAKALALRERLFPEDGELLADILSSRASLFEAAGRRASARVDLQKALWAGGRRWARREETRGRLKGLPSDESGRQGATP
jgi:tetratricopeptide (TPR) repeat protein